jgi:predicted nucleic acid-binding protein
VNLVVDASVAYKWLVVEDDSDVALTLRSQHDVVAPDLLLIECRNAALTNLRKGELSPEDASRVDHDVGDLALPVIPSIPLLSDAFAIALRLRHPIYDCVYIAAAMATDRLLVTADKRFAAKAATSGFANGRVRLLETFAATR